MTEAMALLERVVVGGDLSKLSPGDRLLYYRQVCESVGLNPLTRPFDYLQLSGRLVLYAKKDATDQLRAIHEVSITKMEREKHDELYVVTAYAQNAKGRMDSSIGAVTIGGLKGDALANAVMKAETKAKRRVTLSICGLGMMDETEVETVREAQRVPVDYETGEVITAPPDGMPPAPASTAPVCPVCGGKNTIRHSKDGGWFCWKKLDGCGLGWPEGPYPTAPPADLPKAHGTVSADQAEVEGNALFPGVEEEAAQTLAKVKARFDQLPKMSEGLKRKLWAEACGDAEFLTAYGVDPAALSQLLGRLGGT